MKIGRLRTNHLENPLGYQMKEITFSWVVEQSTGKKQTKAQIQVSAKEDFSDLLFDSGPREDICSLGYDLVMEIKARTRYFWRVLVWADDGDSGVSPAAWFETSKLAEPWRGEWVTTPFEKNIHPLFRKEFSLPEGVRSARAYVCGLGLYELEVNGVKAGDEYLAPFYNDYASWVQYQAYDVTEALRKGENALGVTLGNGWYKGRFGFVEDLDSVYGDRFRLLCELVVTLDDGSEIVIGSDTSWLCHPSPVLESSIYNGESYDASREIPGWSAPGISQEGWAAAIPDQDFSPSLEARLSPPVRIIEKHAPVELIHTPAGEQVLDFGQVLTGWVEFKCDLPKGTKVYLQYGEILQEDNFYRENLRSAKAEFTFISDGKPVHVRPRFTFYGFRFVKVEGIEKVDPAAFTACVIHSDLSFTGKVETSNPKVNRLALNAFWGQRGNFLDVPTDCPQRDERMGWTGDAQIFAATASFFMETPAFYHKYMHDMAMEQAKLGGAVPHVVPDFLNQLERMKKQNSVFSGNASASCAWADAATVIPWTLYLFYGDKALLRSHYGSMKDWTDYIKAQDDEKCGGSRLWSCGFHFADWLALDNPDKSSAFGGTDPYFVASCYYYYSASLTAQAAEVLGFKEDAAFYSSLKDEVKSAIQREYFTSTGRIAVDTQTGMTLALTFDLVPSEHKERLIRDLKKKLDDNKVHLTTGFVGTPYLCPALTRNGLADYAYTLLLNEDYPSWLYEVNMGATTIWERWNSVLPDGSISDTGMNSLNHYAYGSILEWVYRCVCGLNPSPDGPGFKKTLIAPYTDARLSHAKAEYESASGTYVSGWKLEGDNTVYDVTVPFDSLAEFRLPAPAAADVNGKPCSSLAETGCVMLEAGTYTITVSGK